ncbi:DEAD/DEAH box helicase [Lacticaseibacillus nasuensis]|uniref:DEAD/DEAH box helicase n=1 Tax=Lacticaseibacillus nasuensis TaxID=944671 RepID=UPI002245204F|nr:DEAD/DEAH box helicase [Lacticaseibacillus nasuensis]MCX2454433.1 DEAD/DEAH box helicase [Lacticaseibacillus nasuensis]
MSNQFSQFALQPFILQGLTAAGITTPTPVQQQVIPVVLRGQSVVGQSQTGSGKTHAFMVPLLNGVDVTKQTVQVIITAPSRELAEQLYQVATQLAEAEPALRIHRYVGGTDKARQVEKLRHQQPHVVIGTPGRILDLIQAGALASHTAHAFVVDEADMTLDLGFLPAIDQIAATLPKQVQMLVFSATIPQKLQPFLKKYLANPEMIELAPSHVVPATVTNLLVAVNGQDKNQLIYRLLTVGEQFLALVFVNTKASADHLTTYLKAQGLRVAKIHGDVPPRERKRVMKDVMDLKYQYVVATDLAARGIDIEGISLVINAEIPRDPDFFMHRVGRTGRNGLAGTAITLYEPGQEAQVGELEHLGIHFIPKRLKNGELVDGVDRNRREHRQGQQTPQSLKIRGMVKKEQKKRKPGYKKKIKKAAEKEAWFNRRVAKRTEMRASRKAHKQDY